MLRGWRKPVRLDAKLPAHGVLAVLEPARASLVVAPRERSTATERLAKRAALLRLSRPSTPDVVPHIVNVELKATRGLLYVGLRGDGGGVHYHVPLAAFQPAGASTERCERERSAARELLADAAAIRSVVSFHVGEVPPFIGDSVLEDARLREAERGDRAGLDVDVDCDGAPSCLEPAGAALEARPREGSAALVRVALALLAAVRGVRGRDSEHVVAHVVEAVFDHALLERCGGVWCNA